MSYISPFKPMNDLVGSNVWLTLRKSVHVNKETGEVIDHYMDIDAYPWADASPCPAQVLADYGNFILVEILPHQNPNCFGDTLNGLSKPYKQSLHKHDILCGRIGVKRI